MKDSERCPLPGSERHLPAEVQLIEPCPSNTEIRITVYLRPQNAEDLHRRLKRSPGSAAHPHLTPDKFAERYGAAPADIEAVKTFARSHQLRVIDSHPGRRSISLSGTAAQMSAAFGVTLHHYRHAGGIYRLRQGSVYIPKNLEGIISAIVGLDNRPLARPHFRIHRAQAPRPAANPSQSYTPLQLAKLYDFPDTLTGQGETIGIIELGGGFNQTDLDQFFQQLSISPAPQVIAVSVDGATNSPTGNSNSADGEVELDIEVAGAIAPGAKQKIFFGPNSEQGFLDAVTTAVQDADVTIISISWGQTESVYTAQGRASFNQAFQDSGAMGKTIFVSAGDNGSSDGQTDGANHVDFPAGSPYVVACGGTTLRADTANNTITSETVWNEQTVGEGATGGGVSDYFPKPDYQSQANVPPPQMQGGGRGVPDVAGDADPITGYQVFVDGKSAVVGGTSAVAPLYAGLFARINQGLIQKGKPRVGFVNPALYQNASAFRDIVSGNNGAFSAGPGWDPTTGLGSPDGAKILGTLGG